MTTGYAARLGDPPRVTPLLWAPRLGAVLGLCRLHLKVESVNLTGSHKDRVARLLVEQALADGAGAVTVGSCGNLGVAVSAACAARGLACRVLVPARYRGARTREMTELGAVVERTAAGYEEAVEASRDAARTHGWFDANPNGPSAGLFLAAYAALAVEIVAARPDVASVWVPAGNGTTAAGIARGLTPAIAVCVGGSVGNTAVTASVAAGAVVELNPMALRETEVNEPLVNWRSLHGAEALAVVRASGGFGHEAADGELLAMAGLVARCTGVSVLPAATAALVGLVAATRGRRPRLDPCRPHVAVLTA